MLWVILLNIDLSFSCESPQQESAYVTEVHHVNREGEDAGVVYCEMQGCENTGENRTHLALIRAMYPGACGYKSETGGMLENLRTSTSHRKVGGHWTVTGHWSVLSLLFCLLNMVAQHTMALCRMTFLPVINCLVKAHRC